MDLVLFGGNIGQLFLPQLFSVFSHFWQFFSKELPFIKIFKFNNVKLVHVFFYALNSFVWELFYCLSDVAYLCDYFDIVI